MTVSDDLEHQRLRAAVRMIEEVVRIRGEGGLAYTSGVAARMMTRAELHDLGFERFAQFVEWVRERGLVRGVIDHGPGMLEIDVSPTGLALVDRAPTANRYSSVRSEFPQVGRRLDEADRRRAEGIRRGHADAEARGQESPGTRTTSPLIKAPATERFVPLRSDLWNAFVYTGSAPRRFFFDRARDVVISFTPGGRSLEPPEEAAMRRRVDEGDMEQLVEILPIDRGRQLEWLRAWRPERETDQYLLDGLLNKNKERPFEAFLDFIREPGGQDLRWGWNRYRSARVIQAAEAWRTQNGLDVDLHAAVSEPGRLGPEKVREALHWLVDGLDDDALAAFAERLGDGGAGR